MMSDYCFTKTWQVEGRIPAALNDYFSANQLCREGKILRNFDAIIEMSHIGYIANLTQGKGLVRTATITLNGMMPRAIHLSDGICSILRSYNIDVKLLYESHADRCDYSRLKHSSPCLD